MNCFGSRYCKMFQYPKFSLELCDTSSTLRYNVSLVIETLMISILTYTTVSDINTF